MSNPFKHHKLTAIAIGLLSCSGLVVFSVNAADQSTKCTKPIECFTLSLQNLHSAQSQIAQQNSDLQKRLENLDELTEQLKTSSKRLVELERKIDHVIAQQARLKELDDLSSRLDSVSMRVDASKAESELAARKIDDLKSQLINGTIVARKAEMLQGRDANHWMRFKNVDPRGFDVFSLWRSSDGSWWNVIRVGG
jgi:peptidoglycan hydrolase CwlO-like protein